MEWLPSLAAAVLAAVLAITLHEAAHGYAALAEGDPTARDAGRLSLNPLRHVDLVGTLLLPGFLVISQLLTIGRVEVLFGWARPVPVNPRQMRDPRWGMVRVAAAGPAVNFVLAILAALAAHPLAWFADALPYEVAAWLTQFLGLMIVSNLILGLFNLLPIPPLDGGRILVGLLPYRAAMAVARLERVGLLVVIFALVILPRLPGGIDPIGWALRTVVGAALRAVLTITGHG
ncbi:Zn-dependent protease [Humitalea rosea]|uniref:Zn-dependent protease n=1 Tax=Humitalea rosea TaxID=990373 RepID=A0A2W7ITG7_9PROT|nr:site-2 protease family protein [Humitalea rosea]PZW49163.1 Zn-dependent protease [Humitalea rosea]